jgi:hypothetical protein
MSNARNRTRKERKNWMENENEKPPTTKDLIALVRRDCLDQAKQAHGKLTEAIDCLEDENHLGALGATDGLGDDIASLTVFLRRIARLTGTPPRAL